MNKLRREAIAAIAEKLEELKSDIETLKDEEGEYYDNMPESLQGSEKGEKAEAAVSAFESAMDSIDEALSSLEEAAV